MHSLLNDTTPLHFITDRSQMLAVIGSYLAGKLEPGDIAAMASDLTYRPRLRELPFSTDGIVGKVSTGTFTDMVGSALHEARKELQEQQQNGEWVPVAWETVSRPVRMRERSLRQGAPAAQTISLGGTVYSLPHEVASAERYEEGYTMRERICIRVVFVDMAQSGELDNWELRTGRKDSPMFGGKVPASLRREYNDARDLLQRFGDYHAVPDAPKVAPAQVTRPKTGRKPAVVAPRPKRKAAARAEEPHLDLDAVV